MTIDIKKEFSEALSLVDGVTEVIEIYKAQSPAQQVWKMNWLFNAHELINKNSEIIDTIDRLVTHSATSDFCSSEWKNDFDKATNIINKIKQAVEDRKQSIIEDRDYPFFNIIEDIINA
jgi:hypothetical protein